jgi:hypothetical protein
MNSIGFHCLVSLLVISVAAGSVKSVGTYAFTKNTNDTKDAAKDAAWANALWANAPAHNATNAVNSLLGDISFVKKFGYLPTPATNEKLRIGTHLEYVEQLLRNKDASMLPKHLQQRRTRLLAALREYRLAGKFPRNDDYPNERKPCFIDKRGNICAVGYLIEQTAGRELAERINARYQYAQIHEMALPELTAWVRESGLTAEECAMIQPTYYAPIPTEYAVASGVLSGLNLALTVVNMEQINTGSSAKAAPIIGLATGGTAIVLGSMNLYREVWSLGATERSPNGLSVVNICLGAVSIITSTWNLFSDTPLLSQVAPTPSPSSSLNIFSFPTPQNQMGLGVRFTQRLGDAVPHGDQ